MLPLHKLFDRSIKAMVADKSWAKVAGVLATRAAEADATAVNLDMIPVDGEQRTALRARCSLDDNAVAPSCCNVAATSDVCAQIVCLPVSSSSSLSSL
jgi:hypothetical protein